MSVRKQDFFWASYTDLMTTLFFVMLVLYVITFLLLKKEQSRLRVKAQQYEQIENIEKQIKTLAKKDLMIFEPVYKRYLLKENVQFDRGQKQIPSRYHKNLIKIGNEIKLIIDDLSKKGNDEIRYLILIEGMSSDDNFDGNYELSYDRALSLFRLWEKRGITFDEKQTEVLIAGSGTGGVGRAKKNADNQRFLIQIIPKITTYND
jgi:flagellar motor protein MotB